MPEPLDDGLGGAAWKAIADLLAAALRQCQVPADWPMAWPNGLSEGTPWVDEALAAYEDAQSPEHNDGKEPPDDRL